MRNVIWKLTVLVLFALALLALALPVWADHGGRNTVLGGEYTLQAGERLEDDLVVLGGKVQLQRGSLVKGDVSILGGEASIEGTVDGDVVIFGGAVALGSSAVVEGNLVILGSSLRRHPEAQVKGNTVEGLEASESLKNLPKLLSGNLAGMNVPRPNMTGSGGLNGLFGFMRSLGTLVAVLFAAALVVTLLPEPLQRITELMTRSWLLSMGIGALTIVALAVLMPVLAIIIIGIPVVIVLGIASVLCALLGWVAAGKVVGQQLLQALRAGTRSPLAEVLVGSTFITLLALTPCVGPLLSFLVVSWGLGAVVLTRLGTTSYPGLMPFAAHVVGAPQAAAAAMAPGMPSAGVLLADTLAKPMAPPQRLAPPAPLPPPPDVPAAPGSGNASRGDTRKLDESALHET